LAWVALAAFLWLALLLVPWRPWLLGECLEADPAAVGLDPAGEVTVLMPARNEAAVIGQALSALAHQGLVLPVIVIDDDSTDGTAEVARGVGLPGLTVITAPQLPAGWTGKLWALEQGRARVTTPYILLLDADIRLAPATVPTLLRKAKDERLALLSLMAAPAMVGFWDRWFMPAFIYFFKLLYPFRWANRPSSRFAAAAGGCLLVASDALAAIGGFGTLRGAVIDDCTLAGLVKRQGRGAIWVGVTHSAVMMRANDLRGFWRMVARTAFTQLRYSWVLLALCTVALLLLFVVPVTGLFLGGALVRALALGGLFLMVASYAPTARFYRQSRWALVGLPLVGVAFLLMTYTSALWYARGVRSQWKDRAYSRE